MLGLTLPAMVPLAGCAGPQAGGEAGDPVYLGVETQALDEDLVALRASMRDARDGRDVEAYAECAAARYAQDRGDGFVRHVRTLVTQSAGIWVADAVYTVSPALPAGLRTIDAEVTVANCARVGIPVI
jgi:hypothetical protein